MAFQKRNHGNKLFSGRDILMNIAMFDKSLDSKEKTKTKKQNNKKNYDTFSCGDVIIKKETVIKYAENKDIDYVINSFKFRTTYIDNSEEYINFIKTNKEYRLALSEVLNYMIYSYNLGNYNNISSPPHKISRKFNLVKKKIYDHFVEKSLERKRVLR